MTYKHFPQFCFFFPFIPFLLFLLHPSLSLSWTSLVNILLYNMSYISYILCFILMIY